MASEILSAINITKRFASSSTRGLNTPQYPAVDGVSLGLNQGEIVALVGESGCGKTSFAHTLIGLHKPTSGQILFDGQNITHGKGRAPRELRRNIQLIFQDPYSMFNPMMTVRQIMTEPLRIHKIATHKNEQERLVWQALDAVGLSDTDLGRRPKELSGGEKQRVAIASALLLKPKVLLADEPVSMIDTNLRSGVLKLLHKLRLDHHLALLFITHDITLAQIIADRIAVMYLGRIVEVGPIQDVLGGDGPAHPYTRALCDAQPVSDPRLRYQRPFVAHTSNRPQELLPSGCRFYPRCPEADTRCTSLEPMLLPVHTAEHTAACWLLDTENHRARSPQEGPTQKPDHHL